MRDREKPIPGCTTCIHRDDCEYNTDRDDYYCQRWQSKEPPDRGPSPADLWSMGEDIWQ